MKPKHKIGIVAGDQKQIQCIELFEPLRDQYNFTVYAFDYPEVLESAHYGLPLRAYNEDPKMPGFMKGLEDQLSGMDAIIAIETSRLASFQGLRAARKFGIPIGVVTTEYRPFFYEKFRNIRAIQCDIYNKSSRYWTLSSASTALLKLEGVAPEFINELGPRLSQIPTDAHIIKKRRKFRKYIELSDDHIVILAKFDLEPSYHSSMLLQGFAQFLKQYPASSKMRLLVVGSGSKAQEMKYLAADLGIGKYVMFIHQKSTPFLEDLLAASDLSISLCPDHPESHEAFPQWIVAAMANRVIPLFESGCQELELVSSIKNFLTRFSFLSNSPESLAALLMIYLKNPEGLVSHKNEIYEHSKTFLMDQVYFDSMNKDLEDLIHDGTKIKEQHGALAILKNMENLFLESRFTELLCLIEETLLRQKELGQKQLLSVLGFKGDTLTHLGDLEKAEETYRYGLSIDPDDLRCLRGLGHLNWQCHAHDQALSFFKKAVHKSPEDGLSCFGIGMVYSRLGLGEDAVYWLERSLQAQPPAPGALMAIAQTCAGLQQTLVAITLLSRIIENLGEHNILLLTLGQLYLADGKESLGNELIAKAMSRRPMIT